MRLWLIERGEAADFDEYQGAVIRAETEVEAREIAERDLRESGVTGLGAHWARTSIATCKPLDSEGEPGVILSDNRGS